MPNPLHQLAAALLAFFLQRVGTSHFEMAYFPPRTVYNDG
jgi:hypothetical protein